MSARGLPSPLITTGHVAMPSTYSATRKPSRHIDLHKPSTGPEASTQQINTLLRGRHPARYTHSTAPLHTYNKGITVLLSTSLLSTALSTSLSAARTVTSAARHSAQRRPQLQAQHVLRGRHSAVHNGLAPRPARRPPGPAGRPSRSRCAGLGLHRQRHGLALLLQSDLDLLGKALLVLWVVGWEGGRRGCVRVCSGGVVVCGGVCLWCVVVCGGVVVLVVCGVWWCVVVFVC